MPEAYFNYVGYFATFLFTLSYLPKDERTLLGLQVGAALTWLTYGILRQDKPVIIANVLVAGSASIKLVRMLMSKKKGHA